MYRIYQLEEVIHENLRPGKSQEVQAIGGKRKSYNPDPDGGEALGRKPRWNKAKKDVIESAGRGVVAVGEDASAGVDKGSRDETGERAGDDAELPQVKKARKRKTRVDF